MSTLTERFNTFDRDNPHIYRLFCKYTWDAINAGRQKLSHWMVINRIRWDADVLTETEESYKISNDFIALYARKFMEDNPKYTGIFTIKQMKRA